MARPPYVHCGLLFTIVSEFAFSSATIVFDSVFCSNGVTSCTFSNGSGCFTSCNSSTGAAQPATIIRSTKTNITLFMTKLILMVYINFSAATKGRKKIKRFLRNFFSYSFCFNDNLISYCNPISTDTQTRVFLQNQHYLKGVEVHQ